MFAYNWPLIVGACIAIIAGEIMVYRMSKKAPAPRKAKAELKA